MKIESHWTPKQKKAFRAALKRGDKLLYCLTDLLADLQAMCRSHSIDWAEVTRLGHGHAVAEAPVKTGPGTYRVTWRTVEVDSFEIEADSPEAALAECERLENTFGNDPWGKSEIVDGEKFAEKVS